MAGKKKLPERWQDRRKVEAAALTPSGYVPGMEDLPDWRERLFIMLYVRDGEAVRAAETAFGNGPLSPRDKAMRLLSDYRIVRAIQYQQRRLASESGVTLEWIVGRLQGIADANIGAMVTVDPDTGRVAFDLRALSDADWRTIKSLKVGRDGSIAIELHDAAKALETLGRHLGMGQGTVRVIQEAREEAAKLAALMSGLTDQELADLQRIGGRIEAIAAAPTIDGEASEIDPGPEEEGPEQGENG